MQDISLRFLVLVASAFLARESCAQTYTVSPRDYATVQGDDRQNEPFASLKARWQQIHGDLHGKPMTLNGIWFRKSSETTILAVPRRIDMVVICSDAKLASQSSTFASNYLGTPVTVLSRSTVTFPSWTYRQSTPEPWSAFIPFSAPYAYAGTDDLLWEVQVHGNTAGGAYPSDAHNPSLADRRDAAVKNLGAACKVTGSVIFTMRQSARLHTLVSTGNLYFGLDLTDGLPNSPAGIMIGLTNPDLTIPGLCTKLYSLSTWTLPWWTDGVGRFSIPPVGAKYDTGWDGQKLFIQTVIPDLGQPGLPFALTQGQELTLPGFGAGKPPLKALYDLNHPLATTGLFQDIVHIVRFSH